MKAKPKKTKPQVNVVTHPEEFFKQQISVALKNQKLQAEPNTEFYLVNLMKHFMFTENFFHVDENGDYRQEILALLLGKAMTDANRHRRHQGLRRLGDVALYTAGFFSDSLSRKTVDIDYYIGMGKNAYQNLARTDLDDYFRKVFADLADRFHKFVDVLAEVSEAAGATNSTNILRIYELWLKTKSRRLEKHLKELGITPQSLLKLDWQ